MAITYPRPLINNARMQECWFDIMDDVSAAPYAKGTKQNLSQVNDPVWRGTFVSGILEKSERPTWSAWRKSLGGGIRQFVAYDVRHSRPLAYPNAANPAAIGAGWDGTAAVSSVGAGGALGLNSLPSAFQFKAGDRVGLEQNGFYGYYEVLEDKLAVLGVVTVTVTPLLHSSLFNTSAVCRVWRPLCKFIIGDWVEQGTMEPTPVSFTGVQRL